MFAEGRTDRKLKANRNSIRHGAVLLIPLMSLFGMSGRGATGPHGTVDLIAEPASVQPARPFWVGLHFRLEKGWHLYWTNPGDSGMPPRVKWNLGLQAGSLQWPIPSRIEDHSLIDYGYQDEVLLPVEITFPAKLMGGSDVQLNATVNWLVCRDICIPGRADLTLTLPVRRDTPGPLSPEHSLFAKARAALPRVAPPSWKVTARLDMDRFVLNVDTGKRETTAAFFPFEPNQIENAAPQKASPSPRGIRIEMQKSDQLLISPPRLTGVLVLASGQGYVIDAPLMTSK
jgi:DsbC/DsbD-like thiol-disulfide interchange protein